MSGLFLAHTYKRKMVLIMLENSEATNNSPYEKRYIIAQIIDEMTDDQMDMTIMLLHQWQTQGEP